MRHFHLHSAGRILSFLLVLTLCFSSLPFAAAVYESSMDESQTGALLGEGTEIPLRMRPFEIRTLRVVRK